MSKFNKGDKVKRIIYSHAGMDVGDLATVKSASGDGINPTVYLEEYPYGHSGKNLALITSKEDKPMRRTFKLLKDTPLVKKGAIIQEDCEDGTQPYSWITPEFAKGEDKVGSIRTRRLVEEAPEWFVEVFAVEPAWMTKEELEKYHTFLKGQKPAKRKYTKKTVKKSKTGKTLGRPRKTN